MKNLTLRQRVRHELYFAQYMIRTNLAGAMELRGAFLLQVFGMMINNTAHLSLWIYFFRVFGNINGWTQNEVIGLQGILAFVFGVGMSFGNGIFNLPDYVDKGTFDQFLLSPRNLYLRILTSKMGVSSLGDILFGGLLMIYYLIISSASLLQIVVMGTILIPVLLSFLNYSLVINLAGFLVPDAAGMVKNFFQLMLSPGTFPYSLYQGFLRFFFIFLVPALVVGGLPVDVIHTLSLSNYLLVWAIGLLWTALAVLLLKRAVRRYESGNLTGARV